MRDAATQSICASDRFDPTIRCPDLGTPPSPSGEALIEIHDTGLGISSAALRQVFEPFYTTKPPGMGTGLGLTISHDIARTLGGRIEVESSEGRGSVFRVALPPIAHST
jgi:signal transduction histidine kinase